MIRAAVVLVAVVGFVVAFVVLRDTRIQTIIIWGGVCLYAYSRVFKRRLLTFRKRKDARSSRELMAALSQEIAAVAAALAIAFLVLGPAGSGLRGFFFAAFLGAFAAAGVVQLGERQTVADGHEDGP